MRKGEEEKEKILYGFCFCYHPEQNHTQTMDQFHFFFLIFQELKKVKFFYIVLKGTKLSLHFKLY